MADMNDVLFMILKVIASIAIALITKYVIPALKTYIETRKDSRIYGIVETAVRAAEQTITESGKGIVKKEQVENVVYAWMLEKGYKVSKEQLDQLIEECVYMLGQAHE